MPKKATSESKPATKAPNDKGDAPDPSAGSTATLDLTKYRTGPAAATPPTEKGGETAARPDRPRRQKVKWQDLNGILGLRIVEAFQDTDPEYGPYVGCEVEIPESGPNPAVRVFAMANENTRAGKALSASFPTWYFDEKTGVMAPVPVHVGLRKSQTHPDGNPMVLLSFGEAALRADRAAMERLREQATS